MNSCRYDPAVIRDFQQKRGSSPTEKHICDKEQTMQKYYLIGSPISHSLSPKMHNLAFRLTGIDATYGLCEADETLLVKAVDRLVAEGASGFNVTMPDKTAMCDLCDELSDAARIGRSVNTVKVENGRLIGDTTDGRGFLMAADKAGFAVTGQNITLLGTGGAASAILIDSALSGAKHIFVFYNRESSSVRVREIAKKLASYCDTTMSFHALADRDALREKIGMSSLLVNATNVGMKRSASDTSYPDASPIPDASYFYPGLNVFDAIYNPRETCLLRTAAACGCNTLNGLPMLLYQGAVSFKIWTGCDFPANEIREALFPPSDNPGR